MRRLIPTLIVALVALTVLNACGVSGASQTPTSLPTATPDAAATLRTAIDQTKRLTSYRLRFRLSGTGAMGGSVQEGNDALRITSAVQGDDIDYTYGGVYTGFNKTDAHIRRIGSQVYWDGPLHTDGGSTDRWYTLDPDTIARLSLSTASIISGTLNLVTLRMPLNDFAPDGQETLHGQTCTRFRGGSAAAYGAFDGTVSATTAATPVGDRWQAMGYAVTSFEALAWVCPDGYLHQLRASAAGQQRGEAFTLSTEFEMSEPNGPIVIAVPPGAFPVGPVVANAFPNGMDVRASYATSAAVTGHINPGEAVVVLQRTGNYTWYRVMNERGVEGWVSADHLTLSQSDANELPSL